ncbi:uncharacterized protein K452DRAFT_308860 [Aplosporella prunicola CBS 121167]|uniref:RRM domain-containing protein n=1 Tax=Aplosporella prunicola CBS 121167 TaxID=1176127 RepID=A0A6A6BC45_9PEZI|nr:uncharacterized protein K452DRAFT_308860 [Aplosporella prunicola CBS 121167]KAF2141802.1 hypothetical protein K452DRAFT_308860 [Aplosporella prunicola CBS 121167]
MAPVVKNDGAVKANSGAKNPPNQTLYVSNLPDKLQKQDLRRSLYLLFSTYGTVLDVVALKTMKMRGQAHIVFKDIMHATQAMRSLQGFDFFGKNMAIDYARGKSVIISKLEGTGPPRPGQFAAQEALPPLTTSTNVPPPAPVQNGDAAGAKRKRDDESDTEEKPMEEDEDEDQEMDVSDED